MWVANTADEKAFQKAAHGFLRDHPAYFAKLSDTARKALDCGIQAHRVSAGELFEAVFGERTLRVEFLAGADHGSGVTVRETFEPETTFPVDYQRAGWQAILDRFKGHVERQG